MYNHGGVVGAGGGAAAGLPFTGMNSLWMILTAFALLSVGTALLRIVPRREG